MSRGGQIEPPDVQLVPLIIASQGRASRVVVLIRACSAAGGVAGMTNQTPDGPSDMGATGFYSPGIVVVAPLPCLVVATIAAFLAPLLPRKSRSRAPFTSAAVGLSLVASVTFSIDISWGSV